MSSRAVSAAVLPPATQLLAPRRTPVEAVCSTPFAFSDLDFPTGLEAPLPSAYADVGAGIAFSTYGSQQQQQLPSLQMHTAAQTACSSIGAEQQQAAPFYLPMPVSMFYYSGVPSVLLAGPGTAAAFGGEPSSMQVSLLLAPSGSEQQQQQQENQQHMARVAADQSDGLGIGSNLRLLYSCETDESQSGVAGTNDQNSVQHMHLAASSHSHRIASASNLFANDYMPTLVLHFLFLST